MLVNAIRGFQIARSGGWLIVALGTITSCRRAVSPPTLPVADEPRPAKNPPGERAADYRRVVGEAIEPTSPTVISDNPSGSGEGSAEESSPRAPTLNGNPLGLSREALNRGIQGAMGSFTKCFAMTEQDPSVMVSFEADPIGRPTSVRVSGASPNVEFCVRNVAQGIRFPSFEGKGVQVDIPLSFQRAQGSPSESERRTQQAAQGPPLFMEP